MGLHEFLAYLSAHCSVLVLRKQVRLLEPEKSQHESKLGLIFFIHILWNVLHHNRDKEWNQ